MKTLFVDCIGHQFYFNLESLDVLSIKQIESRSGQVRRDDKNEIHLNNILSVYRLHCTSHACVALSVMYPVAWPSQD